MKKETFAKSCLPFVSICPKYAWTGKYQKHVANDGVSSRMLDKKTNTTWKRFLFSSSSEGNSKKPLPSRVNSC